ncbi:M66 family metalloprotease [Tenacibaculum tangerinum]|uniref:M66 family metalloprotease n=1 Tax=Tenacibaculum tangerinum TaxID=3038772 RepID=A0ABY8L522_9FLAO|nr:M66 family metalloprotease [Tenacibaculum tangerinum]WGH75298.1 M66 family metalloprotease [Tenacibaculum tangerinum]
MIIKYPLLLFVVLFFAISCSKDELNQDPQNPYEESNLEFEVFFAQTHVQHPSDELFKLTSESDALIKAQVTSDKGEASPEVKAVLTLNGSTETIILEGPPTLPTSIELSPGKVEHKFEDSFTGVIPKEWVKPGLTVEVVAGTKSVVLNNLKIGAPNVINLKMFDTHFFALTPGDYPDGWDKEIVSKWPTAALKIQRTPNIVFKELTIPPRGNGIIAARVSSKEEYQNLTGASFDGEQAAASKWNSALRRAAGFRNRLSLFYINIYGVNSGGQAGGFAGVGNGKKLGIFHHEIGHAFSLPHWGDNATYPYKGDMHGIPAPNIYKSTHAGPTWAFDMPSMTFIPPTVQENAVGGTPGTYKADPMQGGGSGDQEPQFLLRHFSDFSVNKMRNYLENHIVIWNDALGSYASWDDATGDYTKVVANDGVKYPIEREVNVISVMVGVSATTPQATIVYPPIGPYTSDMIELFDPTVEADRLKADAIYCPEGGCDTSVKVVQGGVTKIYMLPTALDEALAASDSNSFKSGAVNLKAADGEVTSIELLATPDAEKNGLPAIPQVLYSWKK